VNVKKGADQQMELLERPVAPYLFPLEEHELRSYHRLRIPPKAATALGATP
jgi:hypothetical protein